MNILAGNMQIAIALTVFGGTEKVLVYVLSVKGPAFTLDIQNLAYQLNIQVGLFLAENQKDIEMDSMHDMLLSMPYPAQKQAKAYINHRLGTERIKLERHRARLKYEQEHLESEESE